METYHRPEKLPRRLWGAYSEDGDDTRHPTIAYKWDVVKLYMGLNKTPYKAYTNEIDAAITQVYELAHHLSLWFHF